MGPIRPIHSRETCNIVGEYYLDKSYVHLQHLCACIWTPCFFFSVKCMGTPKGAGSWHTALPGSAPESKTTLEVHVQRVLEIVSVLPVGPGLLQDHQKILPKLVSFPSSIPKWALLGPSGAQMGPIWNAAWVMPTYWFEFLVLTLTDIDLYSSPTCILILLRILW